MLLRHRTTKSLPRRTGRRGVTTLAALVLAILVTACGSSTSSSGSSGAQTLLNQTFGGQHTVKSGVLSFALMLSPSGSSTLKGPISLGLSGPFQSRGAGKLPESNLSLSVDALGHHGALGIVSTGTNGYITLNGVAYQLPAADYQKLASSFASAGSGQTSGLAKFGIKPLHWLTNPSVVGSDSVGGAPTTHIRANVNVSTLLSDLSTLLQKASASGAAGTAAIPGTLSPATRQKIAAEVKHPTVDIWTGSTDHTLRKLAINLDVPVSGQISTLAGGLRSLGIGLTLSYAGLNQPQTITAPGNVQPFTGFATKLRGIITSIQGSLGASGLGGAGTSSGSATTPGSGTATPGGVQKYSQCIQKAGSDVTKMQKCAALLNGG
ncbi:MAG: hypothetical protein ACRDNK_09225 [Solirubrobacteraceae bacterium]